MRDENKYRLNTVDKMKQVQNEIDAAWEKAEESAKEKNISALRQAMEDLEFLLGRFK